MDLSRQHGEIKAARSTSLPERKAPIQALEEELRPTAEVNVDANNTK